MINFKTYKENIIEDFIEDCKGCKTMAKKQELTDDQLKTISSNFEEHRKCFEEEYEKASDEASELILSCIYGKNESASIECMVCNTVIIDDISLFGEEED